MILEIKYTINVVCLNHPETISPPQPYLWKNCLLGNLSLVLKRLGTAVLDFVFSKKMKGVTGQFLLSTSEFSSLPASVPILLLFLTLMSKKKKNPSSWQNPILYLSPGFHFLSSSENTASTVTVFLLYHHFLPLLGH